MQWIKCSERMPPQYHKVLISDGWTWDMRYLDRDHKGKYWWILDDEYTEFDKNTQCWCEVTMPERKK